MSEWATDSLGDKASYQSLYEALLKDVYGLGKENYGHLHANGRSAWESTKRDDELSRKLWQFQNVKRAARLPK